MENIKKESTKDLNRIYVNKNRYWLHILLFILTLITTTFSGAELVSGKPWLPLSLPDAYRLKLHDLWQGLAYSLSFIAFLSFHEFGHYFTAVYHRVKCTLPFYIPIYFPFMPINIGSFGAVIRIRTMPETAQKYFDIGVAGPLAGFLVSMFLLTWGFTHLPAAEHIYNIHPEYQRDFNHVPNEQETLTKYGIDSHGNPIPLLKVGNSLIFWAFEKIVADPSRLPNHLEIMHNPFLFVGFITLFFTALNLLPIGQLDGGHVIYGLFGHKRAAIISRVAVVCLMLYGGIGMFDYKQSAGTSAENAALFFLAISYFAFVYFLSLRVLGQKKYIEAALLAAGLIAIQQWIQYFFPLQTPNILWLFYAFLSVVFIKLDHPITYIEKPLDFKRKAIGWFAIFIFIISFSPEPIKVAQIDPTATNSNSIITQVEWRK